MGMAASQVRFLSLQNRKNTIGLNLMTLSNRKTALSRDMSRVANEYNNAMNQKVLKWSNDSGVTYSDLTYDKLMKPNELNTTKPYIITDAQGRVVLDDNVIELEGKNTGVTYRQLASMISAYSGLTNDKTTYNHTNNGAIVVDKNGSNEITNIQTTAVAGSGLKDGLEYTIPTNVLEYDFQNSLRYDLMKQLDLISESDKSTFDNLIKEQYGSDKFKKGGDYSSILSSFDTSVKVANEKYGDYSDAFGEIQFTNNSFVLNGGSNLGNLALAKAYLAEYKAYLNTDLKRDILVDSKKTVASTTAGTSQLDATNTTNPTDFKYDSSMNKGISNRMLGLLSQTGEVTKNGNNYQLNMSGILNHLGFYKDGNDVGNLSKATADGILPKNCYHYDEDNKGRFDKRVDNSEVITNWGTLYDFDGGFNTTNKSYDRNGDGYIYGSDYVDNEKDNKTTGISIRGNSEYDKRSWKNYKNATGLEQTIEAFANSMLQVEDINVDAVKYAQAQTKDLYEAEYNTFGVRHNGKGPGGKEASRNHAAGAADSLFGFGYDTIGGHTDPVAFNVTNMINAFITFYEMYVAVDGDTSRIKTGATGAKAYKSDFNALANNYNDNYVQDMKKNINIMEQAYSSFINEAGATVTNNDSGSHKTGEKVTITYTKKSKDPETNNEEEITENLTVEGIWGTTGFSSISKLSFISAGKKTEELGYTVDSSNNKTLTQTNYDSDGKIDNTVVYKVDNSGKSEATIDFKKANKSNVNQITIQDGSVKTVNGSSNLEPYQTDERAYYITKKGSTTDEADPEYKYKLVMGDEGVKSSVFAGTITTKPVDKYSSMLESLVSECQAKVDDTAEEIKKIYASFETKGMDYFDALFKMISKNGWVYDENVNNTNKKDESKNYLNAKLQNNMYFITEVDTLDGKDYNYATKLATNVSKVFQVYDTDAQNQALSKYESEKADINSKEKQIDIRMNKLETEQDAIKTELDSIKSIIKDNVDTTFKIFT